jgi:hypothetical protein
MMEKKSCLLSEDEIQALIQYHARQITNSAFEYTDYIERIKYLNKRLMDKKEIN